MSEEIVTVKILDTNRMIIVEFENKGTASGFSQSFFEAFQKYLSNDMKFIAPYPPKISE